MIFLPSHSLLQDLKFLFSRQFDNQQQMKNENVNEKTMITIIQVWCRGTKEMDPFTYITKNLGSCSSSSNIILDINVKIGPLSKWM